MNRRIPQHVARLGGDAGVVAVEFALVMGIVLVTFFALAIYGGRVVQVENEVRSAAHEGARAASLAETSADAENAATAAVEANLARSGIGCAGGLMVGTDTSRFTAGGRVGVTVTCVESFDGVSSLGVETEQTFQSTAIEVIDRFRSTG